jgi:hypothetical protein
MSSIEEQLRAIAREEALAVIGEIGAPGQQPGDDEGIDAKEVARMLGYFKEDGTPNTWSVYELAKRGIIESFRPSPSTIRFNRGKIRRYIERGGCAPNENAQRSSGL